MIGMVNGPVKRAWGSFTTTAPLTQSYPNGKVDGDGGFTRTRKQPGIGGAWIPVYSGNAFGARVHRAIAEDLFARVGIDLEEKKVHPVTAHLMLVGGSLPKDGLRTLTVEGEREARSLFPMLSLFGGTLLNTFMAARLRKSDWVALTAETAESYLRVVGAERSSLPDPKRIVFIDQHVRSGHDLAQYWSKDEIAAAGLDDAGKSAMRSMPYGIESVAVGVQFVGSISLADYRGLTPEDDAVQRSCLRYHLETTYPDAANGYEVVLGLGGAQGKGCVEFSWGDALESISDEAHAGERYFAHVEAHKKELHKRLTDHSLVLVRKPKDEKKGPGKAVAADGDDAEEEDDAEGDDA